MNRFQTLLSNSTCAATEWSNAVTETYALVNFQPEEEAAAENQTLSKPDNQTGVIKLDNSTTGSSKAEEAGAHELANIMATLSHGEASKCTSDGQYLAGTMSIQVSLPPLPEKFKALAASTLVTTAAAANTTAVNYSAAVHAFGIDTSLTLASAAVTGARRCGSDIRHLGRYSLTMPVTGQTSIPITGAVTLRLTQTVLQLMGNNPPGMEDEVDFDKLEWEGALTGAATVKLEPFFSALSIKATLPFKTTDSKFTIDTTKVAAEAAVDFVYPNTTSPTVHVTGNLALTLPCPEVGRCRLIVSKPDLKARLVSALETKM